MENIKSVDELIIYYKKLPGVGNKTAERLAYASLDFSKEELTGFINALQQVKDNVHKCEKCGMYIDTPFCPICDNPSRDSSILMVLTSSKSIVSFEKSGVYLGKYFVLGGSISPIKGITPDMVRIPQLVEYVKNSSFKEVIIACDSTLEGEITSQYIYKFLHEIKDLKVTKLAYGLPMGADLEYVDSKTISYSLQGRNLMKGE